MLITLRHYELGVSSDFSLSALMTRSETTARTLAYTICYPYKRCKRFHRGIRQVIAALHQRRQTLSFLAFSTKTFLAPFLRTPREKRSLVLEEIQFSFTTVALSLALSFFFFFEGNNKSDGRLWRPVRLAERGKRTNILEPLVRQRLLIACDTTNVSGLAHVGFARLTHVDASYYDTKVSYFEYFVAISI